MSPSAFQQGWITHLLDALAPGLMCCVWEDFFLFALSKRNVRWLSYRTSRASHVTKRMIKLEEKKKVFWILAQTINPTDFFFFLVPFYSVFLLLNDMNDVWHLQPSSMTITHTGLMSLSQTIISSHTVHLFCSIIGSWTHANMTKC